MDCIYLELFLCYWPLKVFYNTSQLSHIHTEVTMEGDTHAYRPMEEPPGSVCRPQGPGIKPLTNPLGDDCYTTWGTAARSGYCWLCN